MHERSKTYRRQSGRRPIIRKVLANKIPPDAAAREIKQRVPNKRFARELFDHWTKATTRPEDNAVRAEAIARKKADLRQLESFQKASKAIHEGFEALSEAAMAEDSDAAKDLVEGVLGGAGLLAIVEQAQPEVFKKIAHNQLQWPVLASDEAGWDRMAVQRIQNLDLGADLRMLKTRFRKARGTDANLPAPLWAKAAVRVIEETRWRMLMLAQVMREFGSSDALADFFLDVGWGVGSSPKWRDDAMALGSFCQESVSKWKQVIRQMIREQMPDFQNRPECTNQRRTAAANGRNSKGEIQNAILDDIVSALVRLAPEKAC